MELCVAEWLTDQQKVGLSCVVAAATLSPFAYPRPRNGQSSPGFPSSAVAHTNSILSNSAPQQNPYFGILVAMQCGKCIHPNVDDGIAKILVGMWDGELFDTLGEYDGHKHSEIVHAAYINSSSID